MKYKVYHYKGPSNKMRAIWVYIKEKESNFLLFSEATDHHILLCKNASVKYIDAEAIKKDGVRIIRTPYQGGSALSMMYGSKETPIFALQIDERGVGLKQITEATMTALNNIGIPAKWDDTSSQCNDLVLNGRKICGVIPYKVNGKQIYSSFINLRMDIERLKRYVKPPLAKFKGKIVETVEERVSPGIKELYPNVAAEKIKYSLMDSFKERFKSITEYQEIDIENADIDWERVSEIEKKITSDDYVFSKQLSEMWIIKIIKIILNEFFKLYKKIST